MKVIPIVASNLVIVAFIVGCSRSEPPLIVTGPLVTIELPNGGSISQSINMALKTDVNGLKIELSGGKLIVGGKSFGGLQAKDRVRIDASGKVTVNGEERKPSD